MRVTLLAEQQCRKLGKIFTGLMYKLLLSFTVIADVYSPFIFPIYNYIYKVLAYSVDFKAHWELWNPLSKAGPDKFHGSDEHSKHKCLQKQINFHKSCAWQFVLIFNTGIIYTCHWGHIHGIAQNLGSWSYHHSLALSHWCDFHLKHIGNIVTVYSGVIFIYR